MMLVSALANDMEIATENRLITAVVVIVIKTK